MRELRHTVEQRPQENQPNEIEIDIEQERIILKEKIRQSQSMSH